MTTPWLLLTFSTVFLMPSLWIPRLASSIRAVRKPRSRPWKAVEAAKKIKYKTYSFFVCKYE